MSSSTLEDLIYEKGTVIDFESICAVACDVLGAIEGLQGLGILHNNITTRNILISQCPRVSEVVKLFTTLNLYVKESVKKNNPTGVLRDQQFAYVHISSYMFATADFVLHREVDNYIVPYSKVASL